MRHQNYLHGSGLGDWALMNERENTGGETCLGVGWDDGQLSFRLVDFVAGMGHTQLEMPLDLKVRREHRPGDIDLQVISTYRGGAQNYGNG